MSTIARLDGVAAYAAAVRDHLRALDAETLDDLTGGLEADLADALADHLAEEGADATAVSDADIHDLTARFGPAVAYAEELRAAAGIELPDAEPRRSRRRLREVLTDAGRGVRDDVTAFADRHRWFAATLDLLVALRPVWWVARGWVLFCLAQATLLGTVTVGVPRRFVDWVVFVGLVVVSTQWGRGRFAQGRAWRKLALVASGVIAVAFPFVLQSAFGSSYGGSYERAYGDGYNQGMSDATNPGAQDPDGPVGVVGSDVTNLFVYGPDGEPVDGAQIVDQDGRPLVLMDPIFGGPFTEDLLPDYLHNGVRIPVGLVDPDVPLNVFPYRVIDPDDVSWAQDEPRLDPDVAIEPRWPAGSLFPVPGFDVTAEVDGGAPATDDGGAPVDEGGAPVEPTPGATESADDL
ncbi:conserved hypothetical protein [Beutenbergia cavernae DSM 12333]|uniref:Uncharacterized protein n=1 Tax=Beutenbergia cavernae (strain ATCC BAA-8 / DSM 12333 / CCUG 43141 / JCM 11478 / NBRC 16432 / NCIMB 13614 / HKI 0122) TaxID=471853 RepID=C5C0A1_BEUC1|nr:hypothetical protein [Beutenbergia cavernae]ACQ79287.1 conserved hypothetical protein [Beutenbergia cavernae DSM 12333]